MQAKRRNGGNDKLCDGCLKYRKTTAGGIVLLREIERYLQIPCESIRQQIHEAQTPHYDLPLAAKAGVF